MFWQRPRLALFTSVIIDGTPMPARRIQKATSEADNTPLCDDSPHYGGPRGVPILG